MAEAFALDPSTIEQLVYQAVQKDILSAVQTLGQDPVWLAKIETLINQAVVYQTISKIGSIDINTIIRDRVDENIAFKKNFAINLPVLVLVIKPHEIK